MTGCVRTAERERTCSLPSKLRKKLALERLFETYNRRGFIHPDPVEFLHLYPDPRDREVVGLIASGLAYGQVRQILKSVSAVLEKIPSPAETVCSLSFSELQKAFSGFKHRWTSGEDVANLLFGAGQLIRGFGTLEAAFRDGFEESHESVVPALSRFCRSLCEAGAGTGNSLLSEPDKGSACKRLHLFLRWMVRRDEVDPGGWSGIPPSKLIVPLDVHMHRLGVRMGLTERRQANVLAALEITAAFRELSPNDPVRYDFSLTRLGILKEVEPLDFWSEFEARSAETRSSRKPPRGRNLFREENTHERA